MNTTALSTQSGVIPLLESIVPRARLISQNLTLWQLGSWPENNWSNFIL